MVDEWKCAVKRTSSGN